MVWFTAKNVVVRVPNWRSISLFFAPSLHLSRHPLSLLSFPPPFLIKKCEQILFFRGQRYLTKATKREKLLTTEREGKDLIHILWWKERIQKCQKPSTLLLIQRLTYTNLLGLDVNLRCGSMREGTLNSEILVFKSKFPREVLLCRVGDFYEAIGFDACILVEYAGLNPFGGVKTDGIPKAGCPVVNLRQTLDDLTRNGFSVCIVEEIQGPTQGRVRKSRFISGHAHPGSPYVFGLLADDCHLDFPEPMPVVGISRSAKGYCMVSVLETMKTYSVEDCLTEEALVVKLRTCQCHHLFLHGSLKQNTSGTSPWGEFGEGGLLRRECITRAFEWFEGDPVNSLLSKVKELYGTDSGAVFRDVTVPSENRPHPLHLGTATQIGAIPTEGIPCLLKVLLPSNCTALPVLYVRDLLLNPPAYDIASKIQETAKLMINLTCSIPEFTCISSAKFVKLLELREASHIEFCRIKSMLDEVLHMHGSIELNKILRSLMDPTWAATGLKVNFETLVEQCTEVSSRIGEIIYIERENYWQTPSFEYVPKEFVEDMESSWKCRVKKVHLEEVLAEVEKASEGLALALAEDFVPIVSRVKAMAASHGGRKGEILYVKEHGAVWFKGKHFMPTVWAGTPGEEQIKQLIPALDLKRKKVGDDLFTTEKVEKALMRYHEANAEARMKVLGLLRILAAELQTKINILVFASMLLIIAKALFAHVSEGRRRQWVFPTLYQTGELKKTNAVNVDGMKITGLSPYWLDVAQGNAVQNTVDMRSLFLLTGPNGGGKSSLLRSICAAALLGICGLMVPAESAIIPHFDSIMLHMKAYDSPVDGKSSFQVEMSEIRTIILSATSRSLVLIDEICRGTETAKGTCVAGSVIETLDGIGCLGIVSTHLHGIFDLPLATRNVVYKAMSAENVNGQTIPTCKLIDGICKESLAFETAENEGVPSTVILRAEALYLSVYKQGAHPNGNDSNLDDFTPTDHIRSIAANERCKTPKTVELVQMEVDKVVTEICQKKLAGLCKNRNSSNIPAVKCVPVAAGQKPPPSAIGASCVYIMFQPGNKLYVGVTGDLEGRIRTHRAKNGLRDASFLYFTVPGKSIACQLETLLINQLPTQGFELTNIADGKHRNFGTCELSLETASLVR